MKKMMTDHVIDPTVLNYDLQIVCKCGNEMKILMNGWTMSVVRGGEVTFECPECGDVISGLGNPITARSFPTPEEAKVIFQKMRERGVFD